jgi:hypothetical protein
MPPTTPFGDGHAAEKIIGIIRQQAVDGRPSSSLHAIANSPSQLECELELHTSRLSPIA